MLNEILDASPRISTVNAEADTEEPPDSFMDRKASLSPPATWKENVLGKSEEGIGTKDSQADTAGAFALNIPYLSQLKYL